MSDERRRCSDLLPDDLDGRTVDRWPVEYAAHAPGDEACMDTVNVPRDVADALYAEMAKRSRGAVHWPARVETGTFIYDVALYADPLSWSTHGELWRLRRCEGCP